MRLFGRATAVSMAVAILVTLGTAGQAQAEAYRYWGYFQWVDGSWQFAATGPADTTPEDGALEGWRHAVGDDASTRAPRTGDVFDELCGDATAGAGEKRVAVVIDYGTAEDAGDDAQPPQARGDCAVVPADATGADVLASVADVRMEDGLTCGIDGFPASGCGGPVDGPAPTDAEEPVELSAAGQAGDEGDDPTDSDNVDGSEDQSREGDEDGSGLASWLTSTPVWVVAVVLVLLISITTLIRQRRARHE